MQNWKQKLAAFMYGRYGADAFGYGLLAAYMILYLAYIFTRVWAFSLLSSLSLIFMIFRMFSRNYPRRKKENEWFLKWWTPVSAWFTLQFHRVRDCRTSVYRKCPHCKAVLKLPRRRGSHTVCCPRCAKRFDTRVLF